jgi:hypothetical protein
MGNEASTLLTTNLLYFYYRNKQSDIQKFYTRQVICLHLIVVSKKIIIHKLTKLLFIFSDNLYKSELKFVLYDLLLFIDLLLFMNLLVFKLLVLMDLLILIDLLVFTDLLDFMDLLLFMVFNI